MEWPLLAQSGRSLKRGQVLTPEKGHVSAKAITTSLPRTSRPERLFRHYRIVRGKKRPVFQGGYLSARCASVRPSSGGVQSGDSLLKCVVSMTITRGHRDPTPGPEPHGVGALLVEAHGCSLHHSGHLTLWGVRVACTMVRCSAGLSVRGRRANAGSTSHGSRTIRAVSR
jgi:hypothetical protein